MKTFVRINLSSVALRRGILASSLAREGWRNVANVEMLPMPNPIPNLAAAGRKDE